MPQTPKISIVMPVYNVEKYLADTLNSVRKQTFKDFEIICVDDGSTDRSVEIQQDFAAKDRRFVLLNQKNAGAGAARNVGFAAARGEYVIFLDSDDLFSPHLLEKLYEAAKKYQADVAACNFTQFDEKGNVTHRKGIHQDWLETKTTEPVFNYNDCPDLIMSVVNPTPWNKLYRRDFIAENNLKYEEISSSNDITFAAVSIARAQRITYIEDELVQYRIGHTGTISSTKTKKLNNVLIAVSSAARQAKELPYRDEIMNSILRFQIDNYIFALQHNVADFSDPIAKNYYEKVHEIFTQPEFELVTVENLHNKVLFEYFCTIRKYGYETIRALLGRKLIVSLTTYPARIGTLHRVLETIYAQTRPADEVILWLAEEQFPGKEAVLPHQLHKLMADGKLTVRWCDDLKPHKKYFYALQEYPDDLVVTIDDDLLYSKDLLDNLWKSYMQYPNAVSTARAHLVVMDEQGKMLSYSDWIKETDACLHEPSMQLIATGGAGALYQGRLFKKEFFDKEAIIETCLWADDLWLKAMQVVSDVPVVVAQRFQALKYLPGSQDGALCHANVDQNQNDVQLEKICQWLDESFEPGILEDKLYNSQIGTRIVGIQALCRNFANERKMFRSDRSRLYRRIAALEDELSRMRCGTFISKLVLLSRKNKFVGFLTWVPRKIRRLIRHEPVFVKKK